MMIEAQPVASFYWHQISGTVRTHPILTCLGVFLLYILNVRYNTALRHIPGPVMGSLTRLWKVSTILTARQEVVMMDLHKKHGKLVRIGPTEVSISDPEALKTIYGAGSKFTKTRWYPVWNMGGSSGKWDIFSDTTHDRHAANKRMVSNSYSSNALAELDTFVQHPTDRLLQRMGEFSDGEKPMNLSLWLQWYAFDVIGEVSFSKQFGFLEQGKDIDNTLKNIEDSLWSGIVISELPELDDFRKSSMFQMLPFAGNYEGKMNLLAEKAKSVLAERRQNTAVDRRDLLSRFFAIQKENPDHFDDLDILILTTLNIFAGSDTTSIALRAILYYLIQNPRCHEILVKELDVAYRAGNLSEKSTFAEAQKLPYLQACIKEAMRLHPSLGTQHVRWVPEGGVTVAGTYLPAKTTVGINAWVMHRQKSVFGEDAEIYRPERWIEGDKGLMERHLMTFGYGAHVCLGKNIALLEINKVVPQILRSFKLRLAHSDKGGWRCISNTFVVQKDFEISAERRVAK